MTRRILILLGMSYALFVFASSPSYAEETPINKTSEPCLGAAKSDDAMLSCMEGIFSTLEAKRIILEDTAEQRHFDPNSTIDWDSFYAETLENSRHFFEEYRKAECTRKEILSSTGFKSKYEKLTCEIRMTKDRINALQ